MIFEKCRNRCSMRSFFLLFLSPHVYDLVSYISWLLLYLINRFPNKLISCHLGRWPVQHLDFLTNYTIPLYSTSANHNHTLDVSELWIILSLWPWIQSYLSLNLLFSPTHHCRYSVLLNSQCPSCLSLPSCPSDTPWPVMPLLVAPTSLNSTPFDCHMLTSPVPTLGHLCSLLSQNQDVDTCGIKAQTFVV